MKNTSKVIVVVLAMVCLLNSLFCGCIREDVPEQSLEESVPNTRYGTIYFGIEWKDVALADLEDSLIYERETEFSEYCTVLTEETQCEDLEFPLDSELDFTVYGWELLYTYEEFCSLSKDFWSLDMVEVYSDGTCIMVYGLQGLAASGGRGSCMCFVVSTNDGTVRNVVCFD